MHCKNVPATFPNVIGKTNSCGEFAEAAVLSDDDKIRRPSDAAVKFLGMMCLKRNSSLSVSSAILRKKQKSKTN